MPELPEVETVVRQLRKQIVGRQIVGIDVLWKRTVDRPSVRGFVEALKGQTFTSVTRRGKYLLMHLDNQGVLLGHLRMSGDFLVEVVTRPRAKHVRVAFLLDDGRELRFDDTRKFGRLYYARSADEVVGDLGPEPLSDDFTVEWLRRALKGKSGKIKTLLLDQRFLAGLGNIYVVESLWRSKIHPLRVANSLTEKEIRSLHRAIRDILTRAVESEGTDIGDGVWKYGQFNPRVYGREGLKCSRCRTEISRIVLGQRGTEFCGECQREG